MQLSFYPIEGSAAILPLASGIPGEDFEHFFVDHEINFTLRERNQVWIGMKFPDSLIINPIIADVSLIKINDDIFEIGETTNETFYLNKHLVAGDYSIQFGGRSTILREPTQPIVIYLNSFLVVLVRQEMTDASTPIRGFTEGILGIEQTEIGGFIEGE